jgi:hypothetical protein
LVPGIAGALAAYLAFARTTIRPQTPFAAFSEYMARDGHRVTHVPLAATNPLEKVSFRAIASSISWPLIFMDGLESAIDVGTMGGVPYRKQNETVHNGSLHCLTASTILRFGTIQLRVASHFFAAICRDATPFESEGYSPKP